jgi:hypothetical protein
MAGEGDVIGGGDGLQGPAIFIGQGADIQYREGQQFGPLMGGGGRGGNLVSIIQQNIMGEMGTGLIDTPAPKEYYFINTGSTGMEGEGGFTRDPDLMLGSEEPVGRIKALLDSKFAYGGGALGRMQMGAEQGEQEAQEYLARYADVRQLLDMVDDNTPLSDLPATQQAMVARLYRRAQQESLRRIPDEIKGFGSYIKQEQVRGVDFQVGDQTFHTAGVLANVNTVKAFGKVGDDIDPETLREVSLGGMGRRRLDFYLSGVELGQGQVTWIDDGSGRQPTQTIWSEFKTGTAGSEDIIKAIADARDVVKQWVSENKTAPTQDLLKLQMVSRRFAAGAVSGAEGLWQDLMTGVFSSAFQEGDVPTPNVPQWMQRLDFEQGGAMRFRAYGEELPPDLNSQLRGMNSSQIGVFLGGLFTSNLAGYAPDLNPNMTQRELSEYFEGERKRAQKIRARIGGGQERVESAIETPLDEDDALSYIDDLREKIESDKERIQTVRRENVQDAQRLENLRRSNQSIVREKEVTIGGFGREALRPPSRQPTDVPLLGRGDAIFSPDMNYCWYCNDTFYGDQEFCPSCGYPKETENVWGSVDVVEIQEGWVSYPAPPTEVIEAPAVPERLLLGAGFSEEEYKALTQDLAGRKFAKLMGGRGMNEELFPFLFSGAARQPRTRGGQFNFEEIAEVAGMDYFREELLKTANQGVEDWMKRGMGFTSVSMDRSFDEIYSSYKKGMEGDDAYQSLTGQISEALTGGDKTSDAERFRQMQDRFKTAVDQSQIRPDITKIGAIKGVVAGMDMREIMLLSMDYARVTSEAEMRGDNTIIQNSMFRAWGNSRSEVMGVMEQIKKELDESFDKDAKKLLENYSLLTDKTLNIGIATDATIWFPTNLNSGT